MQLGRLKNYSIVNFSSRIKNSFDDMINVC